MKTIVICGSMAFKKDMLDILYNLEKAGFRAELPLECMNEEPKHIASRAHFNRIIDKETDGILVVNKTKNGLDNYIGPNSFAEIAFAFFHNKQIYLLNDIYEPYKDELTAWNAIPLHNKLENIK